MGRMVRNEAFRVVSTNAWTGINALLIDARLGVRTIAVHDTFRPTLNVGIAVVFGQATARSSVVSFFANCVRAAG